MSRTLFRTDKTETHYAVVIVRTGVAVFTANTLDLAKARLRSVARDFGELEVREVVTTTASRRAYRPTPKPAPAAPACREDRDLAIPVHA
jgi:hypothetical protein